MQERGHVLLGSCAELQLMPWVDCTPISLYIFVCEHPRVQRGSSPILGLVFSFLTKRRVQDTRTYCRPTVSSHSNFSTSAAICAMGERGGNRNRVTGQELLLELSFGPDITRVFIRTRYYYRSPRFTRLVRVLRPRVGRTGHQWDPTICRASARPASLSIPAI